METIIKTASIRIALAYQYSTFEVALNIENENGILNEDLIKARRDCQLLATDALNEYKGQPNQNPKQELARVETKLAEIKKLVTEKEEVKEKELSPKEIAEVEKMPLYSEVKKATENKKVKK